MTMVRKQIYIEKAQDEALKREARRRGVTEATVIRDCLDRVLPDESEAKRREAGKRLIATLRQGLTERPVGSVHKFRRDEAYDDRLNRLSS